MINSFTLIHPSRGRAEKARYTHDKWVQSSTCKDIQYIISLDIDDPQLPLYKQLFPDITTIISANTNLVQAVHKAVPYIENQCTIVVSDDFDCPVNWDQLLLGDITQEDFAIYVNDGCSWGQGVMTLPIVSTSLVRKLGYVYYPEYTGMFVDDDLYQVCDSLGVLIKKNILFEHNHYTQKKSPNDDTYKRHNTKASWDQGKSLLKHRRANNFNLELNGKA